MADDKTILPDAASILALIESVEKKKDRNFASALSVQMFIGPEGDFTSQEIQCAIQNHYQPVTLGNTRLRAETAGVVAATLLCI